MPTWLYDAGPSGLLIFTLVTVVLGGLAALATGRALAMTWRSVWLLAPSTLLLACGVRFIHYAVFAQSLLSLRNLVVDVVVLMVVSLASYRWTRRQQMARQYGWSAPSAAGESLAGRRST
jgi:hypothetical protein